MIIIQNIMGKIVNKMLRLCMDYLRLILVLSRPYSDKVLDAIYRFFGPFQRPLPPISDKVLLMPATKLADKIRKRQLKSEDVVRAFIERIKEVNPILNACVDDRFDEALNEAAEVDRMLASSSKSEEDIARDTPLLGVPFSCKESVGVKGLAQTSGYMPAKGRTAPKDSEVAAMYRKAGAIPVAVTNVPQLCTWWESANQIFGRTISPYDSNRSVGGSSGGEATIITAAGAVIGVGNDLAGSIRVPASFCGIFGHKPSRGVISNEGSWPADLGGIDNYVSTGPMCRYAQDIQLLTKILSGANARKLRLDEEVDFHKVNVYYIEEFPGFLVSAIPEIKAAVRKAATHFEDRFGVTATKLCIEELRYALEMWECKLLETGGPPLREALADANGNANLFFELLKNMFSCSDHTLPAIYFSAIERREKDKFYHTCLQKYEELERKLNEILKGDAILLVPTHPEPPPHYLMTIPKYPNLAYTCIFSILGYPSTTIPAGLIRGLPIGIQAISSMHNDHLTLSAAVELEKVLGGWKSPGPIVV